VSHHYVPSIDEFAPLTDLKQQSPSAPYGFFNADTGSTSHGLHQFSKVLVEQPSF